MKILIVNTHLETGGIRQSLLNLIDNITTESDNNLEVELQLLKNDNFSFNKVLHEKNIKILKPRKLLNIHYHTISQQKNFGSKILKMFLRSLTFVIGRDKIIKLLMLFTSENKNYDIAIAYSNDIWATHGGGFYGGCNDYVLRCVRAEKKIAWIHNDPERLGINHKKTYEKFDEIVNVSFACKQKFDDIIPEFKHKSKVVYNMINMEKISNLSNYVNPYINENVFRIVTVARLDNQQKNIDKVIYCCEKIKETGIHNFEWHIVGDGPDMDWLMSLSRNRETDDVVIFHGQKDNPYPYMKYADVLALVSNYEAYGMVVAESLAVGTPVICTSYPAAHEIVIQGINGVITNFSVDSICSDLIKLIKEPKLLRNMREYLNTNKGSNEIANSQFKEIIKVT